ncbi:MAG: GNAT family N-acetyltransferase [Thermoleophilaceae bacterium]
MPASIRPEQPSDFDEIRRLLQAAFEPSTVEAPLVDALREEGAEVPELCLVAHEGDALAGHIFYSRARLDSGQEVLALAPMAVAPARQRTGIGSRLIEESLARAAKTECPLIVVVGHADYYPRFGFRPAREYGLEAPWELPPEAWMALPLAAYERSARGRVNYPAAFDEAG